MNVKGKLEWYQGGELKRKANQSGAYDSNYMCIYI